MLAYLLAFIITYRGDFDVSTSDVYVQAHLVDLYAYNYFTFPDVLHVPQKVTLTMC